MSVEPLVISALVEEGNLRKAFQEGISAEDFQIFSEEFSWIERRSERHRSINQRVFLQKFPDFEFVSPKEDLKDLLVELKQERAYSELQALLDHVEETLEPENSVEVADHMMEVIQEIRRLHSPTADIPLIGNFKDHIEKMRQLRVLRKSGVLPGIPTGIEKIDYHWDGLVPGRLIVVLGRPGEGKSYLLEKFSWEAMRQKCKVGLFSPEMNEFEHQCRLHTIASADPEIQQAVGITSAFRNRALMRGEGFNLKKYRNFCEHLDSLGGEIVLFTQKYRRSKMSPAFIESKIQDLGLDMVIIDPIYKLRSPRKRENKIWELGDIVDSVQHIAKSYNIPVVISNQANRQGVRSDAPHKDSSFNSDAPAQESDHVIGVKHESEERTLILRCTKSRFGENFRVHLNFRPNIGIMEELAPGVENGRVDAEVAELV